METVVGLIHHVALMDGTGLQVRNNGGLATKTKWNGALWGMALLVWVETLIIHASALAQKIVKQL